MEMNKEILEVIAKNLPAQVVDILRERLEEATRLEIDNTDLRQSMCESNKYLAELRGKEEVLSLIEKRSAAVDIREIQVTIKENNMLVEIARLKQAEAEKRADVVTDIVKLIFGLYKERGGR